MRESSGKPWKIRESSVKIQENPRSGKIWEHRGKLRESFEKILETLGKLRAGKLRESFGKAPGKLRENPGKSGKIRENPGKSGKIRENPGKSGKAPGKALGKTPGRPPGKSGKALGQLRENPGKCRKIWEDLGRSDLLCSALICFGLISDLICLISSALI